MNLLYAILEFLFPARCGLCPKAGASLCAECLRSFPSAERESAKWIFPIYDYRHPGAKKALWLFKYNGKKNLAKVFAEAIYEKMLEEIADLSLLENFREPILVPIPLSRKRLRERGYNQSELICREIIALSWRQNVRERSLGRHDGAGQRKSEASDFRAESANILPAELISDVLYKPHDTEHQARIKDRRERLQNMRGTFAIKNGEKISGRNIILVDDILTTGATLSEARRVLREAGARKVIAFTVAH